MLVVLKQFQVFIFILACYLLTGCNARIEPAPVERLDSKTLSDLARKVDQLMMNGHFAEFRGMFSPSVAVTHISPKGRILRKDYSYILKLSGIFLNHGKGYSSEILGEAIIISPDQRSATVELWKKEKWWFTNPYSDISMLLVERMEWQLIDEKPQIVQVTKEVVTYDAVLEEGSNHHSEWPETLYLDKLHKG